VNVLVFTDTDLDGSGSALFIKWLYGAKLNEFVVIETTESMVVNEFNNRKHSLDHYDKIFVLDLCLNADQATSIDRSNVVVIDHHLSHAQIRGRYVKSKAIVESAPSCIGLLRDKFKSHIELTEAQDNLIDYIDDYDSYGLKYKDSFKLNAIHTTYNRPKVDKFIEAYNDGFKPYTVQEKNAIKLFIRKFRDQFNDGVHIGMIKNYKAVAIFADYAISEVANYMVTKHDAQIGIVVNIKTNTVSFRRCMHCDIDLSILARTFCNGGGSHKLAGGKLTMEFANLIKNFKHVQ
tara:strand:+ start:1646 stop:2518 length:873 start_codon:yes stop_codon:yes gene_type:complete